MKTLSLLVATTLAVSVRAADICAAKGNPLQDPYYSSDTNTVTGEGTYDRCGQLCSQDQNCQAMAYDQIDSCLLFDSALDDDTFERDESSTYYFSDRRCYQPAMPPASQPTPGVPKGCPYMGYYQEVRSIIWVNTTHNVDCARNKPDIGDGKGCLNSTGQWCEPGGADQTCTKCGIDVCSPKVPEQPVGYGPPDTLEIYFGPGVWCRERNPSSYGHAIEIGVDRLSCGGNMSFVADSNTGNGYLSTTSNVSCGPDANGKEMFYNFVYNGTFRLKCQHDAFNNASCIATGGSIMLTDKYRTQ